MRCRGGIRRGFSDMGVNNDSRPSDAWVRADARICAALSTSASTHKTICVYRCSKLRVRGSTRGSVVTFIEELVPGDIPPDFGIYRNRTVRIISSRHGSRGNPAHAQRGHRVGCRVGRGSVRREVFRTAERVRNSNDLRRIELEGHRLRLLRMQQRHLGAGPVGPVVVGGTINQRIHVGMHRESTDDYWLGWHKNRNLIRTGVIDSGSSRVKARYGINSDRSVVSKRERHVNVVNLESPIERLHGVVERGDDVSHGGVDTHHR